MKFLSLRTVYRVFPIIKHSKILGPRPVPTPAPIDLTERHTGILIKDYRYAKFDRDRLRNDGETLREKTAVEKNKKELELNL